MLARRREGRRQRDAGDQRSENESAAQRHDRENTSMSVSVATAPPIMPSIAAVNRCSRVGIRSSDDGLAGRK
jgi:hypothetical protein